MTWRRIQEEQTSLHEYKVIDNVHRVFLTRFVLLYSELDLERVFNICRL